MNIDKIYFLELYTNEKRKLNVQEQICKLKSINYSNIKIFENYQFPKSFVLTLKEKYNYLDGAFSCQYGHYAIMKNALINNYKNIMICEDDVVFNDNLRYITDILNNVPNNYGIVKLYWSSHNDEPLEEYININEYLFQTSCLTWSTKCFMINEFYMKKYIEYVDNNMTFADYPFNVKSFISDDLYFLKDKHSFINKDTGFNTTI